jgi:hypothetical protein
MSVEQFLIQPPASVLVNASIAVIAVLGVVLIVFGLSSRLLDAIKRNKHVNEIRHMSIGFHSSNKYVMVVSGVLLLILSIALFSFAYEPSTVTVGFGI